MVGFIPVAKLKRCPLLPSKIKLTRTIRATKSISQRLSKNQTGYIHKIIEIFVTTETPLFPTFSNVINIDVFTEIVLFFIFRDDFNKIFTRKNFKLLTLLIDILVYRILIPIVVHYILFLLNHKFLHLN